MLQNVRPAHDTLKTSLLGKRPVVGLLTSNTRGDGCYGDSQHTLSPLPTADNTGQPCVDRALLETDSGRATHIAALCRGLTDTLPAASQQIYFCSDLGTLGGSSSRSFALNIGGKPVGEAATATGDIHRAGNSFGCRAACAEKRFHNRRKIVDTEAVSASVSISAFEGSRCRLLGALLSSIDLFDADGAALRGT